MQRDICGVIDMKVVFTGLESSGKSLKLAMVAIEIAYRNAKWLKESGNVRPIWSNMKFSLEFQTYCVEELGVPIRYWFDISELIECRNADVFIDELGTYFDARNWSDLSADAKRWIQQGAKSGIEMYAAAQDFAQVDLAFRRLTNHLLQITKICGSPRPAATKPPVKRIWGLCLVRDLDPTGYDESKKKFASSALLPKFFFIRREFCEIFDTGQFIQRSKGMPMQHVERFCSHCSFAKISHI